MRTKQNRAFLFRSFSETERNFKKRFTSSIPSASTLKRFGRYFSEIGSFLLPFRLMQIKKKTKRKKHLRKINTYSSLH